MKQIVHKVWVFVIGPYLWAKAIRDHNRAINRHRRAQTIAERQIAFDATWEPFNRTFDHLIPAFVMTLVYIFTFLGIAAVVVTR